MPKKNGINKTYSFPKDVVDKMNELCQLERRTQTNVIEVAIEERWRRLKEAVSDTQTRG